MNPSITNKQSYGDFLKFMLPSVLSMVFLSFYTTIDGFFVSHYVGANALAAINIIIPITCVSYGVAVMLATGGGAIVGIKLGEGNKPHADRFFTFLLLVVAGLSVAMMALGLIFMEPILRFCGSTDVLLPYTRPYGLVTLLMTPVLMLKLFLEYFARVDGNPKLAMVMSTGGLVLNIVFDYLFIVVFRMGILGAGLGTGLSILCACLIGLVYFAGKRSHLTLQKPLCDWKGLLRACYNGSSEMLTELSTGITTLLFNLQMLRFCGENGVAAMSVITYLFYFFIAFYFGIAVGSQPIISYSYGAKNGQKIKEVLRYGYCTVAWSSVLVFAVSFLLAQPIVSIFTTDAAVLAIAVPGLRLFSFGFLMMGFNVLASGYFTAIGNGGASAVISTARALVFVVLFLYTLSAVFGLSGVWLTVPIAELATLAITVFLLKTKGRSACSLRP